MATVFRIGWFHFPYAGRPRDVIRGALAGLVLFGAAGAAMGYSRGLAAYGLDGAAVGATIFERWHQTWPAGIVIGMVAGAVLGGALTFCAGAAWEEKGSAIGVIVVGLLGGVAVAAAWGSSSARHRTVTIRAELPGEAAPAGWSPDFKVADSDLQLTGTIEHRLDVPMLAFMVVAGAVVGALAGRGLAGDWPRGEVYARPADGAFQVTPFAQAAGVAGGVAQSK